jgi:putative heme-binding domain-containing protein
MRGRLDDRRDGSALGMRGQCDGRRDGFALGCDIKADDQNVGVFARLLPARESELGSTSPVFVAELDLTKLRKLLAGIEHVEDLPQFPGSSRDAAMELPIDTPNAAIEPGYRIFRVTLKDGSLLDAFFVSEDKNAVVVRQMGAEDRRIERKDIASTQFLRQSLMPEGLLDSLSDQQRKDLLSYLMSLK